MKRLLAFFIISFMLVGASCTGETSKPKHLDTSKAAVKLLIDTDMMTDCDDTSALAMALNLEKAGECEILAMGVSSKNVSSARVVSAINKYYGREDIPIGVPKNGLGYDSPTPSTFIDKVAAEFPNSIKSNADAPDAAVLFREKLANAADNSVTLLTIGYCTNVATLMQSKGDSYSPLNGMDLIRKKVKKWVCMAGNFPIGNGSNIDDASHNVNFTRDPNAAYYAIKNWQGKIDFVGREVGHNMEMGEKFRQLPTSNPVRRAYELHQPKENWNQHTADPTAVLYAVRGLGKNFTLSNPGYVNIYEGCGFEWEKKASGEQHYLVQKASSSDIVNQMESLIMQ